MPVSEIKSGPETKSRAEGHLSLRLDIRIVEELDAVAARMQEGSPGLRVTRADVARVYLLDGMARAKGAAGVKAVYVSEPVQVSVGAAIVSETPDVSIVEAFEAKITSC